MTSTVSPQGCSTCRNNALCYRGLSLQDIALVEPLTQRKLRVERGSTLFRAGEPLDDLYAIRYGTLKVMVGTEDGRQAIAAFCLSGDILGTDGFESGLRTSSAVALEDSEVCAIGWRELTELATQSPEIQDLITRIFSARIGRKQKLMLCIGSMRSEERIATFLLDLSSRFKERGMSDRRFVLRMSREDIANHLAMKLETVSRMFSALARERILRVHHRDIEILDRQALMIVGHLGTPAPDEVNKPGKDTGVAEAHGFSPFLMLGRSS